MSCTDAFSTQSYLQVPDQSVQGSQLTAYQRPHSAPPSSFAQQSGDPFGFTTNGINVDSVYWSGVHHSSAPIFRSEASQTCYLPNAIQQTTPVDGKYTTYDNAFGSNNVGDRSWQGNSDTYNPSLHQVTAQPLEYLAPGPIGQPGDPDYASSSTPIKSFDRVNFDLGVGAYGGSLMGFDLPMSYGGDTLVAPSSPNLSDWDISNLPAWAPSPSPVDFTPNQSQPCDTRSSKSQPKDSINTKKEEQLQRTIVLLRAENRRLRKEAEDSKFEKGILTRELQSYRSSSCAATGNTTRSDAGRSKSQTRQKSPGSSGPGKKARKPYTRKQERKPKAGPLTASEKRVIHRIVNKQLKPEDIAVTEDDFTSQGSDFLFLEGVALDGENSTTSPNGFDIDSYMTY
jgi:hypothetical protein